MNVTCPNCATVYRVDPAKVPEAGVRARCAVCSAVFSVEREGQPTRSPEPARTVAPPAPVPTPAAAPAPQAPPPAPRSEPVRADAPRVEPPRPATVPPVPPAAPRPVTPAAGLASRPAAPPRAPAPASVPVSPPASPQPPPAVPAAASMPAPAPAPAPGPAMPSPSRPPAAPAGARPVNPFLSQDPSLKARRLARALISDMVVYHPAKRQEGLRDGTLKALFEEEIKKSWEEYADQVGREVADSTGYFREALNEILAGGRQIF